MVKRNVLYEIAKSHPSLPEAEEKHFLSLSCNGDYSARDKVILHNIGNAIKCVRSQFQINDSSLREEVEDAAIEALIESANRYDSKFNVRLMTYARQNVILYAWNALIHARTNQTIKLHIYKKVARWIKNNPQHTDSEGTEAVMEMLNCSEFVSAQIFSIVKNGVANISSIISGDTFNSEEGDGAYNYLQDSGTSVTAKNSPIDTCVLIQMQEISDRIGGFCERNLTPKQLLIFKTIITPFLQLGQVVTLKEAADILSCRYQNIDQTLDYMKIRLSNSREGRVVSYIIDCVLSQVKIKRANSKTPISENSVMSTGKKIVDSYTDLIGSHKEEIPNEEELATIKSSCSSSMSQFRLYLTPNQFSFFLGLQNKLETQEDLVLSAKETQDEINKIISTLNKYGKNTEKLIEIINKIVNFIDAALKEKETSKNEIDKANRIIKDCMNSIKNRK